MPEGGYFFDAINRSPGFDEDNLTPAEDFKDDFNPISDEDADWYAENAKLLRDTTDKAIFGCFGMGGIGDPSGIPGGHVLEPKGNPYLSGLVYGTAFVSGVYSCGIRDADRECTEEPGDLPSGSRR